MPDPASDPDQKFYDTVLGDYDKRLRALESQLAAGTGLIPIGGMLPFPYSTPATGWLVCDGSAIPAQYTALIAKIGPTLPDLRKRAVYGAGSSFGVGSNDGLAEGSRGGPFHYHQMSGSGGGSTSASGAHSHGAAGAHQHGPESGQWASTGLGLTGAAGTARYVVSDAIYNTDVEPDHTHPGVGDHTHTFSWSFSGNTSGGGSLNTPSYYAGVWMIRAE